jgi:hypothetical protein
MGGIVVKRGRHCLTFSLEDSDTNVRFIALVIANEERTFYENIFDSTRAIYFFGTPHRGSAAATGIAHVLANIANSTLVGARHFSGRFRTDLLDSLQKDAPSLEQLSLSFRNISPNFRIVSFYEQNATPPFKNRACQPHPCYVFL